LLTKPLGVGIITTAAKGDMATPTHVAAAVESMSRLNRGAVRILDHFTVHACTDVTGFAVIGAAWEMAEGSRALLRFHHRCLPFLDGARDYAGQWLFPGGTCRNQRAYERHVRFTGNVEEELRQLLYTPETSGGLLVAVPGDQADSALTMFNDSGEPCWLVGEVTDGLGVEILD
ncbi:selenide, water dikinase SelD, partial [bacterium]|nr:selenide, water dikinase SelD [candidate division CSSED10-310 bacterium]